MFEAKTCPPGGMPIPPPVNVGPSGYGGSCDPSVYNCNPWVPAPAGGGLVCPQTEPACRGRFLPGYPSAITDLWFWSENIFFLYDRPAVGEEVTVFAELQYWSDHTSVRAQNVPISIYATFPGSSPVRVGQVVVDAISVAAPDYGSRWVFGTWKVPAEGVYIIEFAIDDPGYNRPAC